MGKDFKRALNLIRLPKKAPNLVHLKTFIESKLGKLVKIRQKWPPKKRRNLQKEVGQSYANAYDIFYGYN